MPKVSIICPLYNKADYLKETLDSVLAQTYSDWELVIVDDGSTDNSYELAKQYAEKHNSIRLFKREEFKPNKGASVCRNIGIEKSKGNYILFLDADDILASSCLSNRIRLVKKYSNQAMYIFPSAYFKISIKNAYENKVEKYLNRIEYLLKKNTKDFFLKRFLKYNLPWQNPCVLWAKPTLIKINGFDESFQRLQDPEIHTTALLDSTVRLKNFQYSQPPDVFIRMDEDRHTKSIGKETNSFDLFVSSVDLYLIKFKTLLINTKKKSYIKYLNGYLFSIEANINYAMVRHAKNNTLAYYQNKKKEIYSLRDQCNLKQNFLYIFFIRLHFFSTKNTILKKFKISAMIYKLYAFLL